MRKVTKETVGAFLAGKRRVVGNMSTDGAVLKLHGNTIAMIDPVTRNISVTLAGWNTPTTRDRLNGLCELLGLGRLFYVKRGVPFYRDAEIESTETILLTSADGAVVRIMTAA
jgi:hypothetical protein